MQIFKISDIAVSTFCEVWVWRCIGGHCDITTRTLCIYARVSVPSSIVTKRDGWCWVEIFRRRRQQMLGGVISASISETATATPTDVNARDVDRVCHSCRQLAKITEIVVDRMVYDLARRRPAGRSLTPLHAISGEAAKSGARQPTSPTTDRTATTTIDVASLVINITLNTSRRQAKTPIWDRSNAR